MSSAEECNAKEVQYSGAGGVAELQPPWSLNDDEKAKNPEAVCCTPAPPVMEFDAAGNYIQGWGGESAEYEWPKDEHSIHVDYKGNVWISSAAGPRLRERTENQIL